MLLFFSMQEQRMRTERISVVCFCPQETLRVLIFLLFMCMHILSLLNDQWFYFFVSFFRQQSFIGLSLRIASLPFHLFFFWGGGNGTATRRIRWSMFVGLSVRRSFVPEVKPVTVLLFLLFDTRRCMWCYLYRSVQTDNRDVSHHAPRASYRTHHYHSTLQQNHEVRHTQYSFIYFKNSVCCNPVFEKQLNPLWSCQGDSSYLDDEQADRPPLG